MNGPLKKFSRILLIVALTVPSAVPAFGSPLSAPQTLLSEGFEVGTTPVYVTEPINSLPYNGSLYGYWGPRAFRAKTGAYGLWCNGSRANGSQYQSYSAGWATFDLSPTADYYDSDLSFALALPSRGSADQSSFGVKLESGGDIAVYDLHSTTPVGQWRTVAYDLGNDGIVPFARRAGKLSFKWRDYTAPGESPLVGEGATIDDVLVTGWKYGPVRNLAGVVGTSSVTLNWAPPYGAVNSTTPEDRSIAYRVWTAPGGSSTWTEITTSRLSDGTLSYTGAFPAEGVPYRYGVQAWDPGTGTGYGRSSEVTVTLPQIPPTVTLTAPANNFPISIAPTNITGVAADVGTGVSAVQVRIRRADGYCWDGVAWVAADTWVPANTSNAWENWSYSWTPDVLLMASGQIVTIAARARDNSGAYSTLSESTSGQPVAALVSLADGALETTQQTVNAAVSSAGASSMRYSVNGSAYTAWAPISATTVVDLGWGNGLKTVVFQFSSNGGATVTSVASDTITLAVPREPTALSTAAAATTVAYKTSTSITGTLTTQAGVPLANKPVRLEYYSGGWKYAKSGTTSASGRVSLTAAPVSKTSYRLVFLADADYSQAIGPTIAITPKVYLSTPTAPSTARRSVRFTSYGYLKPRHTSGSYPVRIYKYRYVSGKWKSYGYVKARATNYSSYSKFTASVSLPYAGRWRLRAYAPTDSGHAATYGSYRYLTVR